MTTYAGMPDGPACVMTVARRVMPLSSHTRRAATRTSTKRSQAVYDGRTSPGNEAEAQARKKPKRPGAAYHRFGSSRRAHHHQRAGRRKPMASVRPHPASARRRVQAAHRDRRGSTQEIHQGNCGMGEGQARLRCSKARTLPRHHRSSLHNFPTSYLPKNEHPASFCSDFVTKMVTHSNFDLFGDTVPSIQ